MSAALCRIAVDTEAAVSNIDAAGELRGQPDTTNGPHAWECEIARPDGVVFRATVHLAPDLPPRAALWLDALGTAMMAYPPSASLWGA